MSNWHLAGGHPPARVKALFDGIARRYDLMNDVQSLGLHRRWKRWLVTLAQPQPGHRALDVCCGTGDIAFELARRGATVVGLDFSAAMLQLAQARAARACAGTNSNRCQTGPLAELDAARVRPAGQNSKPPCPAQTQREHVRPKNPCFVQADALRLPFAQDSFDIVTIGYGLRNLADWQAGLAELWRVVRPGGRLLVLDFGKPASGLWRRVYFAYLRWVVPWLGRVVAHNAPAYRYIMDSLQRYPAQLAVAAQLSQMPGVEAVRMWELLGGAMSLHWACKRL